jgi:hypothetical protein
MRSTNLVSAKNQYEANSFATAASTLASSTGTPWAAYDAGFSAAQAANVTAVSNAAKTNAIAQATAQKTAEVAKRGDCPWVLSLISVPSSPQRREVRQV